MHGEFRIRGTAPGPRLIVWGPCNLAEVASGVPCAAFAIWDADKMVADHEALAAFLNAAVAASHSDYAPLKLLCGKAEAA